MAEDKEQDQTSDVDVGEESSAAGQQDPKELFKHASHIAVTMSYDLIDKLRYYEKEMLKLPDDEIAQRIPHMQVFLDKLKTAYVQFAEVDF